MFLVDHHTVIRTGKDTRIISPFFIIRDFPVLPEMQKILEKIRKKQDYYIKRFATLAQKENYLREAMKKKPAS